MSHSPSVLVVGNGPSALVAALVLVQNGVPVRIVEKKTQHNVGQRGVDVQPRTMELFRFLGTYKDAKTRGAPCDLIQALPIGAQLRNGNIFPFTEYVPPTSAKPEGNTWTLGQDASEDILRKHLSALGVSVELGIELVSLTQNQEQVDVVLRHVSDENREEKATFKWVIGADGAHSQVRKSLGLSFLGETKTERGITIGDLYLKNPGSLTRDYWHMWGDVHTKIFSLRPVAGEADRFSFFVAGSEMDLDKIASSYELLQQTAFEISGLTDLEFGELLWMGRWRPNIRMVDQFGVGRVFIIGDAGHCHSPTGGQGMNSSVHDAVNIAWKLAHVVNGHSPPSLLESYNAERLPVIASMLQKTTALYHQLYNPELKTEDALRRPPELRMMGVTYRGSPAVLMSEEQRKGPVDPYRSGEDGRVWPGDRAPDATVGLLDLFKVTHHTILIFGNDNVFASDAHHTAQKWGVQVLTVAILPKNSSEVEVVSFQADRVLRDDDGSAFGNYQLGDESAHVVVVRPDGVIALMSTNIDSLKEYGSLIFRK